MCGPGINFGSDQLQTSIDIIEFIRLLQERFSTADSRNSNSENLA